LIALVIAILEFIGGVIPAILKRLGRKTRGDNSWLSEINYWTGRPRSIGHQFFSQDAELGRIARSFKRSHHVALTGGPGIGKSQLASEFVQKSKRKGFWTAGADTPGRTLLGLAPHLGIEREERSDEELLLQTRQRLQALPAKTLWVIDNLSDLDQLNTLLNETGKISILVTSQDSRENVVSDVDFLPVIILASESAIRLLCRSRRHSFEDSVFPEIVEEVGRLRRALEALAVQLDSPGETPERLLEDLRSAPNRLAMDRFQSRTGGLQIPRPESLFNALRGPVEALPPGIKEALAPLGYTTDLPIPMPLVEELTARTDGALIRFLEECSSKSVLSVVGEQVTLHSLTAAAIAATNPDGSLPIALQRATSRLGTINETRNLVPADEMSHHEHMLSCASPLLDQEDEAVRAFSNSLANAFNSAGRFDEAAGLHQENLDVMERVLGPEHPNTLASRNNLANADYGSGRFEEAASLHQENLEVRQRVLRPEHPDTLATAFQDAGRFDEAAGLHQEILAVLERVLGPEHPDTLGSRNNLANAYDSAGRFKDADADALFEQD